jgi:hypothetical protein
MNRSHDTRLKKLEARSLATPGITIVWGQTEERAADTATVLSRMDLIDEIVLAVAWPDGEPMPRSRRTSLQELTDRELEVICAALGKAAMESSRAE